MPNANIDPAVGFNAQIYYIWYTLINLRKKENSMEA